METSNLLKTTNVEVTPSPNNLSFKKDFDPTFADQWKRNVLCLQEVPLFKPQHLQVCHSKNPELDEPMVWTQYKAISYIYSYTMLCSEPLLSSPTALVPLTCKEKGKKLRQPHRHQ